MATRNYLDDQDSFLELTMHTDARSGARSMNRESSQQAFWDVAECVPNLDAMSSSSELLLRISTLVDGISQLSQSGRVVRPVTKAPHGWTVFDFASAIFSLTAMPKNPYFSEKTVAD